LALDVLPAVLKGRALTHARSSPSHPHEHCAANTSGAPYRRRRSRIRISCATATCSDYAWVGACAARGFYESRAARRTTGRPAQASYRCRRYSCRRRIAANARGPAHTAGPRRMPGCFALPAPAKHAPRTDHGEHDDDDDDDEQPTCESSTSDHAARRVAEPRRHGSTRCGSRLTPIAPRAGVAAGRTQRTR
jgi:hypothetical protein